MKMRCVGGPAAGQSFGELLPDEPAPERYIYPWWNWYGGGHGQAEYVFIGVGCQIDTGAAPEAFALYAYAGPWQPGGYDDTTAAIEGEGEDDG